MGRELVQETELALTRQLPCQRLQSQISVDQQMAKHDPLERAASLITRWQGKVTAEDRAAVTEIMELFGLNVYSGADVLAHKSFLHFDDTATLLARAGQTRTTA